MRFLIASPSVASSHYGRRLSFSGALGLCVVLAAGGCRTEGCLAADDSDACYVPSPCEALDFQCSGGFVQGHRIEETDLPVPQGLRSLGTSGDFLLANEHIAAVFDSIDHPHFLAPTGGSLLDLSTQGDDNDSLNNVFQAVGLLPWDAVSYTSEELIIGPEDKPGAGPRYVAVQFRGNLDGRPDVHVATRYEVRACEPGIRVRSEVVNGEPDPLVWTLTDGFFWGGRSNLPFAPTPGAGFSHPEFGLSEIDDVFRESPYVVAGTHTSPAATYGVVACDYPDVSAFHSDFVSAVGTPRRIVQPRDFIVYERFISVSNGRDVSSGVDIALEVRRQLFDEPYVTVSGQARSFTPGDEFGREERLSLTLIEATPETAREDRIPRTQIAPSANGRFSVRVPAHRSYLLEAQVFGRVVSTAPFEVADTDVDLGPVTVPEVAHVNLDVTIGGTYREAQVFFVPTNDFTRDSVTAKLHDSFEECAPLLGAPHGGSPACNRVLVSGPTRVQVPPGTFDIYATGGPFATIDRDTIEVRAGESYDVSLALVTLQVAAPAWLSADFHVHGAASEDSVIPHEDRVRAMLAANLDVVVASDHDVVFDYAEARAALGADARLQLITGTESTGHVLFRFVPETNTPKVTGHWNFWPIPFDANGSHLGAPWDELAEPGLLMTRMAEAGWPSDTGVAQLNHPVTDSLFGRDLGWPLAFDIDAKETLEPNSDTPNGVFFRVPEGADFSNADYHSQEVMNGTNNGDWLRYRAFWFYLLNQGIRRAGTANSDSHGLTDNVIGSPRTLVNTTTTRQAFNLDVFNSDVRAGKMIGTNGPVIDFFVRDGAQQLRPSLQPVAPTSCQGANVGISVRAAPWVPIEEVRVIVNGEVRRSFSNEIITPADPFSTTANLLRLNQTVQLADLGLGCDTNPADAWIIVEAGQRVPLSADLDCDGLPDTGDNNLDGTVDWRDMDQNDDDLVNQDDVDLGDPGCNDDAEVGPLNTTTDLPTDRNGLAYHFSVVTPGGRPIAFTNPVFLDWDGDGFAAPGIDSGNGGGQ